MIQKIQKQMTLILLSASFILGFSACSDNTGSQTPLATEPTFTSSTEPAITNTPSAPPTTPNAPLAASINGQGLTLDEYQAEISRAQSASSLGLAAYSDADVLQNLIDEILLAQGAAEAGFIPDETLIQTRIAQLDLGSQALQEWLSTNEYSQESFEHSLARSIAAAWMRDQIISNVPSTVEQVHARQILLYNSDLAENVYTQLQAGSDFATLAAEYDPLALGEMGWFPRGYLTVSELDDPVFSLQPGEYTQVIETSLGFHMVQMIDRDPQHPLSPGAFQVLKVQAIHDWLAERKSQSDIRILLP
jgi:parvulin-like peptidyl-prolyl isomerase